MERYKDWKLNIKHLTDFLMSYVSAMEENNVEEMEKLMPEIEVIFDQLYSTTTEESKKRRNYKFNFISYSGKDFESS